MGKIIDSHAHVGAHDGNIYKKKQLDARNHILKNEIKKLEDKRQGFLDILEGSSKDKSTKYTLKSVYADMRKKGKQNHRNPPVFPGKRRYSPIRASARADCRRNPENCPGAYRAQSPSATPIFRPGRADFPFGQHPPARHYSAADRPCAGGGTV